MSTNKFLTLFLLFLVGIILVEGIYYIKISNTQYSIPNNPSTGSGQVNISPSIGQNSIDNKIAFRGKIGEIIEEKKHTFVGFYLILDTGEKKAFYLEKNKVPLIIDQANPKNKKIGYKEMFSAKVIEVEPINGTDSAFIKKIILILK